MLKELLTKVPKTSFIANKFLLSSHTARNIISPSSRDVLCQVADSTSGQVQEAIAASSLSFESWKSQPLYRSEILFSIAELINKNSQEFAILEAENCGKTLADATMEVIEASSIFRYFGSLAGSLSMHGRYYHTEVNSPQCISMEHLVVKEPKGVVAAIPAYNYPLLLLAYKLAPALAAGCTAVLKPAPQTPLTSLYLASLLPESGIPSGVVNVVLGGVETGKTLISSPDVNHIAFTGSTRSGIQILSDRSSQALSSSLPTFSLELGGKNAIVVFPSADLPYTVDKIFEAAFSNSGQNCCGASRLFLHTQVYEKVKELLVEKISNTKLGTGSDCLVGPLIDENAVERVNSIVRNAKESGEKVLIQTSTAQIAEHQRNGYFSPITVFDNVKDTSEIATQEIFGPVLAILEPFETIDGVISRVNATKYGLASGVFSGKTAELFKAAHGIKTGVVWANDYNYLHYWMPFGGRNLSGFGKELGSEGLEEFLFTKTINITNK